LAVPLRTQIVTMRALAVRLLTLVAILALGWTLMIWFRGGLTIAVAGTKLSSTTTWRPFAIGLTAGALALWFTGLRTAATALKHRAALVSPTQAAMAIALTTTVIGLAGNSWTASGPDPFAYVSQAALWRGARLDLPVPLAASVPWPDAVATFAPFGYRAAPDGAPALVPITAPGVPMVMATLQAIFGHWAAFVVTPVAGGALVLLTFAIGRRVRSPAVGLVAAWLVATSPALIYSLMWPMADVPASACAALMVWLLLSESTMSAAGAGLAAAAGTLARPNFIVIAAGAGLWLVLDAVFARGRQDVVRRVVAFGLTILPGVMIMAWLNARWFGSPFASGYGTAADLFSLGRVGPNVLQYARALAETSPLALVGIAALAVPISRVWPGAIGPRAALLLGATAAAAGGVYLLYQGFPEWWYLRFLLPAWPAFFVGAAVTLEAIGRRGTLAGALVALVVIAGGITGLGIARARGAFEVGAGERRYVTIARLVEAYTDPAAVILTSQHSGTVLYYAGRDTVRFDGLDPTWLDRAVDWLAARGRHPYILIEDWEQPIFQTRFAGSNRLGDLSFAPAVAWQSARRDGWVWLFDPVRRGAPTVQPGSEMERGQPLCEKPSEIFGRETRR
jgi:hypothetical protein